MSKENKEKSKINKNKRINWKAIALLVVIVASITTVIIVIKNTNNTNNKVNKDLNDNKEIFLGNPEDNIGLIDMNNTDNVQISEGKKENISQNLSKDRTLEGLQLTEIKLLAENGISSFTATVTNNTGTDFAGGTATILFTNEDGSEYATLEVMVPEIKNGQTNSINAGTTSDITNAYDFTIELQK